MNDQVAITCPDHGDVLLDKAQTKEFYGSGETAGRCPLCHNIPKSIKPSSAATAMTAKREVERRLRQVQN